jgi:ABC-2 type transport system ATP-binding protein
LLSIRNFQKIYHDRVVLTVPTLTLGSGAHYVRGINGAGKSTLFRAVAGLIPFSGEIWLDDQQEVNRHPVAYRRRVSYAEAEPVYPDFLTAHDLITLVAQARRVPPAEVDALADWLGVSAFRHQATGTYSSGMLKKTSLVLALLGRPDLLLLDEPLTTLDVGTVAKLMDYLRDRLADGLTLLLTSHQDVQPADLPITAHWLVADGIISSVV